MMKYISNASFMFDIDKTRTSVKKACVIDMLD